MYRSLQGRYREHILAHNRSEELLSELVPSKDISLSQEAWAKREGKKATKSKYFSDPHTAPAPKKKRSAQKDGETPLPRKGSVSDKLKGKNKGKSSLPKQGSVPDKSALKAPESEGLMPFGHVKQLKLLWLLLNMLSTITSSGIENSKL
ncbi:hypothetical protein N1851_029229 [Merluccius polli]|uniref:Uncharacterized protein n=1 Tax=Merluccius polli TaxID=89951 RepID=A0AA47NRQ9_MERPO|nr:hypothetical protein N1851_029229 [Merluccius polli]